MVRNSHDTLSLPTGSDWPRYWVGDCDRYCTDQVDPGTLEFKAVHDNFWRTLGTVRVEKILEVGLNVYFQ